LLICKKSEKAVIAFYDNQKRILLQDRRGISKEGEIWGFFGGGIEKGETPEQALERGIEEGLCIQILHNGSYNDEPKSFEAMEKFCTEQGMERKKRTHREIYLTDACKVTAAKLKTVLRFEAKK